MSASSTPPTPPTPSSPPSLAPVRQRQPMSTARVALALALFMGLQPITTDLYLPALPAIRRELGASMHAVQMTLAALILAFGVAQLFWGPVADRYGRRPVLLAGLALYTLASIGAALAPDIHALVAWRAVQGACMAATVVCGRSIVRDCYAPHEGVQVMARGFTGLGLIALLGPVSGGLLTEYFGFRAALAALAACSAAILLFAWLCVAETVPRRNPDALKLKLLLPTWRHIARHPGFRAYSALTACTYGGLYAYLAISPFVLIELLGVSRAGYGGLMAGGSLAYLAGTVACRRWAARFGVVGAVRRASWCSLAAAISIAALAAAGEQAAWAIVLPVWLYAFAHGTHQSCGQSGVVAPFPGHAGAASALAGFVLSATAFGVGQLVALAFDGSAAPLVAGIALGGLCTACVGLLAVRPHGEMAAA